MSVRKWFSPLALGLSQSNQKLHDTNGKPYSVNQSIGKPWKSNCLTANLKIIFKYGLYMNSVHYKNSFTTEAGTCVAVVERLVRQRTVNQWQI